jgi:hypothetical protein
MTIRGLRQAHCRIDPDKNLVAILMIQTPTRALRADFETAVMRAVTG